MITIWCPRASVSAMAVVREIQAQGVEAQCIIKRPGPTGAIIWGRGGGSKYEELEALAKAGIPVPPHSRTPKTGWLARTEQHHEARDLLRALKTGDYYVEYIPTVREHRVHVVGDAVVRVQGKVPRLPKPHPKFRSWGSGWALKASPESTGLLPKGARSLAKKAVAALSYKFGAVDIGTTESGTPIVWEVNSQPGLEGGTVKCYARAFIREYT